MALYTKTIVCLANSWKTGGHCVAGRAVEGSRYGDWIRPVSDRKGEEILDKEEQLDRGGFPSILDHVEIGFQRPVPAGHQSENHLIDSSVRWRRTGKSTWGQIQAAVENPPILWSNDSSSSMGVNDEVFETSLTAIENSLFLIRPEELEVLEETKTFGGKTTTGHRAKFGFRGVGYGLKVTDPWVKTVFNSAAFKKELPSALLCVSLAKPLPSGLAYKMVAAIVSRSRAI